MTFRRLSVVSGGQVDDQGTPPAANTEVQVVITPTDIETIKGRVVYWSYSGTPTGGNISIYSDLQEYLDLDITAGGPGFLPLDSLQFGLGEEIMVTLAAGSGSVIGKLAFHGQAVN